MAKLFLIGLMLAITADTILARPVSPPVRPNRFPGGHRPFQNMFQQPAEGVAVSPVTDKPFGGLFETLNHGQLGTATAGGAGSGAVDADHVATGQGTGVAQAGQGGFGIGLGIGGAIATPLGDLAFGQGASQAVGK